MPWFLRNQRRFIDEHEAVDQLAGKADWLVGVSWKITGDGLCIEAIIRAHGHDYPIRMTYPSMYPNLSPIVQPQDPARLWSSHQYNNGVLCLEWGPDNWHPSVTGAQMLESAHHLLDLENPLGSEEHVVAPSRHYLTVGQALRREIGRFYMGEVLVRCLTAIPAKSEGEFSFYSHAQQKSLLAIVQSVEPRGAEICEDVSIPAGVKEKELRGLFVKTDLSTNSLKETKTSAQLRQILETEGHELTGPDKETSLLIMDSANRPHFFLKYGDEEEKVLNFARVGSAYAQTQRRIPSEFEDVAGKHVGIVGLGSVGSKMAISLARTGVNSFLLVDHDVFLPENLCRHELDWRNIGEHKVDAIEGRLRLVAPNSNISVLRLHLTGQESNAAVNGALNDLAQCDLLIDATAWAGVFNLLAAVAEYHRKPLVWMEVYAGGIGGMIARSRPSIDPSPFVMRDAYEEIAVDMDLPESIGSGSYGAENPDETITQATDADVSVIANHATRLALDTLLGSESSLFPKSMYLIGLAKSLFFREPFDVRPIETEHLSRGLVQESESTTIPEAVSLLQEMLSGEDHEDSST